MTTPPSQALATVFVLNWNGRRLLPGCLDALAKQDLDPSAWRAVVIDNGSTDDSLDLLAADYPWADVLRNGENLGFAGGNNAGMTTATTPWVVLLNNDARPEPDWLTNLLAAAQAPGAERVAAVCSKVLFEPRFLPLRFDTPRYDAAGDPRPLGARVTGVEVDGVDVTEQVLWDNGAYGPEGTGAGRFRWARPAGTLLVPIAGRDSAEGATVAITAAAERRKPLQLHWPTGTTTAEATPAGATHTVTIPAGGGQLVDVINNVGSIVHHPGYGRDRGYQEIDEGQYDEPADVFVMCGAAVAIRTAALAQAGPFDPDFFMYYEDTDLSWRLQAAGWSIRYQPDAVVRHIHSASSVEHSDFFTFHVERNRLLMLAKNAPTRLAAGQALRFLVTTGSLARWATLQAIRDRRPPSVRPLITRARVIGSYLRLAPTMLARRRQIDRTRTIGAAELADRWLQPHPQP